MQTNKGLRHVGVWLAAAGLPSIDAALPVDATQATTADQQVPAAAGVAAPAAPATLLFTGGTS